MTSVNHWSAMRERGSLFALKLLFNIYRYGGRFLAVLILYPVILYFFITGKVARSASTKYLHKLYEKGYLVERPTRYTSYKHFLAMGFSALDKVDVWLGKITMSSIDHVNYDIFEPLLKAKKGALLIGSHLGNLEICRALSNEHTNATFNVLVFTEHAQKFNDFINGLNSDVRINLIEVSSVGPDLAILIEEKIAQGEYVVIAGDRTSTTVEGRVIYSEFLGEQAAFSQGPFVLASILHCPVLMMFCLKKEERYQLIFEHLSDGIYWKRKNREAELNKLVNQYAKILEKYCAKYPFQWFNFFDFWQRDDFSRIEDK